MRDTPGSFNFMGFEGVGWSYQLELASFHCGVCWWHQGYGPLASWHLTLPWFQDLPLIFIYITSSGCHINCVINSCISTYISMIWFVDIGLSTSRISKISIGVNGKAYPTIESVKYNTTKSIALFFSTWKFFMSWKYALSEISQVRAASDKIGMAKKTDRTMVINVWEPQTWHEESCNIINIWISDISQQNKHGCLVRIHVYFFAKYLKFHE